MPAVGTGAVALLWGSSGVLVRHMSLTAAQIACGRAVIGAAVLGLWIGAGPAERRRSAVTSLAGRWGSLVLSGALLALHWLTFVMALQRIPIGTVLLGIYLAPLGVAALAPRMLGELITARRAVALLVAVVGSVLVLQPRHTTGWGGLALICCSSLAYAGSIIASKRALSTVPPVAVTTVQLGVVGVLLGPMAAVDHPAAITAGDLVLLGVLGVVYSAFALLAYLAFLRKLSAITSSILLYLEPVSALLAGWLLLGENAAPSTLVGAGLVLAAGLLAATENTGSPEVLARPIE
jgi:drug/metabolite transporter (DMT)-like permease